VRTCIWRRCQRRFLLCSSCDRGHLYCSPGCARAARLMRRRAASLRYQRTRKGRFKHAARQASYRARLRMLREKVTHPSTQELRALGNLPAPARETPPPILTLPAARGHEKEIRGFGSGRLRSAVGLFRRADAKDLAIQVVDTSSRRTGRTRPGTASASPPSVGQCIICRRPLSALDRTGGSLIG
jgi:hypothetical protein